MKNSFFLLIGICIFVFHAEAQNVPRLRFNTCVNCPTTHNHTGALYIYSNQITNMQSLHVVSDFGRRESVPNSKWHLGIDVSTQAGDTDLGDGILPIEAGRIVRLKGTGDYKVLVIQGQNIFGYGHLFFSGPVSQQNGMRCGNFVLKAMNSPNQSKYAIINLMTGTAIAEINSGTVSHPMVNGGQPIPVTNFITDINVPFAPIGDSDTDDAHIHLYRFNNVPAHTDIDYNSNYTTGYPLTHFRNPLDPLEVVEHLPASYGISIVNFNFAYPGTSRTGVQVRAAMQGQVGGGGYSAVNTLDEVKLEIKPFDNNTFSTIRGLRVDSKISEGSRMGTVRYPSQGVPNHNTGTGFWEIADPAQVGNLSRMGINGLAYHTQNYDAYFFTDFYTRRSAYHVQNAGAPGAYSFSRNNAEAYYTDGRCAIRAVATNVRGVEAIGPVVNKIIDNFKPFVEEVTISRVHDFGQFLTPVYRKVCNYGGNGNIQIMPTSPNDFAQTNDNHKLVIKFSEPMNTNTLVVTNNRGLTFIGPVWEANQREVSFVIPYWSLQTLSQSFDDQVCLTIQAQDHNGNTIFSPALSPGQPNNVVVPKRGANNTWTPTGTGTQDNSHCFRIKTCTGGNVAGENNPPNPNTTISSIQWETASGACDGQIDLAPGTNTPYTYQWSNGATTEDLQNLCAGIYIVTVSDGNGCEYDLYAQIESCQAGLLASTQMNCEAQTVNITATPNGCPEGFSSYVWNTGAETATITQQQYGTYSVTTTCSYNGCTASTSVTAGGNTNVQVVSVTPATFNCNGAAVVQVTGNAGPYTYLWNDGTDKSNLVDVCAGFYVLTVTDAYGCTQTASLTINGCGGEMHVWETIVNPCSAISNNGGIELEIYGCRGPYTYEWSTGATTERLSGLTPGNYCVTVTSRDRCCTTTQCFDLQPALEILGTPYMACNNESNGGVSGVQVNQLAQPYQAYTFTFEWSDGAYSADLSQVEADYYCVTATANLNGSPHCTVSTCFTVPESDLSLVGFTRIRPCPNQSNGSIQPLVNGGSPVYTYEWSNGSSQTNLSGLSSGNYSLTVTDQMGCTVSGWESLPPMVLSLNADIQNSCSGLNDGYVHITPSNVPLTYTWNNGNTGPNRNGLTPGQYCVTASTINSCTASSCFQVDQEQNTEVYDEQDCRIVRFYCHGTFLGQAIAPLDEMVDEVSCIKYYFCQNDELYDMEYGSQYSFYQGYYNGQGPQCDQVEVCAFPDGTSYESSRYSVGASSVLINVGFNQCESGMAWADYCNGQLIGINCLNIAGSEPFIGDTINFPQSPSDRGPGVAQIQNGPGTTAAYPDSAYSRTTPSVKFLPASDFAYLRILSNPFVQPLLVEVFSPKAGVGKLSLTNIAGQTIYQQDVALDLGQNRLEITVPDPVPDGFYLVYLNLEGCHFPVGKCIRHRP